MGINDVQYITDANGHDIGVIVPIALWREITSSKDAAAMLSPGVGTVVSEPENGVGEASSSKTRIGTGEDGLPVFLPPPGSPQLTLEEVARLEDD